MELACKTEILPITLDSFFAIFVAACFCSGVAATALAKSPAALSIGVLGASAALKMFDAASAQFSKMLSSTALLLFSAMVSASSTISAAFSWASGERFLASFVTLFIRLTEFLVSCGSILPLSSIVSIRCCFSAAVS